MKADSLPDDSEQLKQLILQMQKKQDEMEKRLQKQKSEINVLTEEVLFLKRLKFARTSEKWTAEDKRQMVLFNEIEQLEDADNTGIPKHKIKSAVRKKSAGRKPIPADIPREEVVHELSGEQRACPHCDKQRPEIGREESEELQFIPAKVVVKKHIKIKYGPCNCETFKNDEDSSEIIKAKAPPRIMPGSIASSGLLSYILVSKFGDSLPLYRMERIFKRVGIEISRTNMANWTIKTAKACEPLIELMRQKTREGPLINMDETSVQVLKEAGRKPENKSYMWVTVGSDKNRRIVLFNYSQTRKEDVALSILKGFSGTLQTDGYAGYNKAASEYRLYHVGCLAHARRKFFDASKLTNKAGNAETALQFIQEIYRVEKELRAENLDEDIFVKKRRKQVAPLWQDFRKWLLRMQKEIPPKTKLGQAVTYTLNEYKKIMRYLRNPQTTPDNNIAENAIRPFVIGRKNWLFCDTPRGAYASATFYSLLETAKANNIEPQDYLFHIFEKLPAIKVGDQKALEELLPWNINK